jgi:hypothetical protein
MSQPEAPVEANSILPVATTKAEEWILHCLQTGMAPINNKRQNLTGDVLRELSTYDLISDALDKPEPTEDDWIGPAVFDAVSDRLEHVQNKEALLRVAVYNAPNQELADHAIPGLIEVADRGENPIADANDYTAILSRTQDQDLRGRCLKGIVTALPKFNMGHPYGVKNASKVMGNITNILLADPDLAAHEGVIDGLVVLNDHTELNIAMQARRLVIAHAADQGVKAKAGEKFFAVAQSVKDPVVRYNDHAHVVNHTTDKALRERGLKGMIGAMAQAPNLQVLVQMAQGMDNSLRKNADNRADDQPIVQELVSMGKQHPVPQIAAQALVLGMHNSDENTLPTALETAMDLAEKNLAEHADISSLLLTNICPRLDENHALSERAVAMTTELMQSNDPNISMYAIIAAERLVQEGDTRAVKMQERWAELYDGLKEPKSRTTVIDMVLQTARKDGPLATYATQCADRAANAGMHIDQLFGISDFGDQHSTPLGDLSHGHHRSIHADGSTSARANRDLEGQLHGLQVTFEQGDGTDMDGDARSVTWMEHGKIDRDRTSLLRENMLALQKTPGWSDMTPEDRNAMRSQKAKEVLGVK